MTNKKSTKKALISSALCLLLCLSMLVGTTFAWFTDSVGTTNNIITAGNLDVNLQWKTSPDAEWADVTSSTNIFKTETLWEPGHTEVVYLKVSNEGSLALKYSLDIAIASETEGTNVANESFKLSDYILYKVTSGITTFADSAAARGDETGDKLNTPYNTASQLLNEGEYVEMTLVVFMPTTVGNEANYLKGTTAPSINLGINLYATQYTKENDSFGPDYDTDAWHPAMTVYTADELAIALKNGVDVKLGADVDYDNDIYLTANLDLGGFTLSAGYVTADGNYAITNGTLAMPADAYAYAWNGITLTLENVVIDSDEISAYAATNGTLILKNVEFNNTATSNPVQNYGGTLIMDDVTVAQSGDANTAWYSSAVQVINQLVKNNETGKYEITAQANTTINSGLYEGKTALFISAPGGNVTINGGTFVGSDAAINAQFSPQNYTYGYDYESVITITGGDFTGALKFFPAVEVVITGGTFSHDPSAYVADGYKAVLHDGVYHVVGENVYMSVDALQAALDAATDGTVIKLGCNMTGDVTVTQKPDVKVTIDGNGKTFAGVIVVDGKSATYTTAGLTIKNVVFKADSVDADAVIRLGDGTNATRYTCNVTVANCHFDVPGVVGIKSYTGGDKNLTITGCTTSADLHSLAQLKGIDGVLVEDCTVIAVRGINFNNSDNVTIKNSTIDVQKYAVRFGESNNNTVETYVIDGCTLKSANVDGDTAIVLRAGATDANLTITNTEIVGN